MQVNYSLHTLYLILSNPSAKDTTIKITPSKHLSAQCKTRSNSTINTPEQRH